MQCFVLLGTNDFVTLRVANDTTVTTILVEDMNLKAIDVISTPKIVFIQYTTNVLYISTFYDNTFVHQPAIDLSSYGNRSSCFWV